MSEKIQASLLKQAERIRDLESKLREAQEVEEMLKLALRDDTPPELIQNAYIENAKGDYLIFALSLNKFVICDGSSDEAISYASLHAALKSLVGKEG